MCLCFIKYFFLFFALLLPIYASIGNNNNNNQLGADNDISADIISHAFVQTGSELHYFRDISHQDSAFISSFNGNKPTTDTTDGLAARKGPDKVKLFEKELTDFGKSALGVPVQRRVFVSNPTDSDIIFSAITSSSIHFHCSFLEQKSLVPRQRTFFRVFFVPTFDRLQNEIIYVHTSFGVFAHRVRGETHGNPYRLRSHFGVRLPLNATFSAPLHIHNPHPIPIRISELFVSDSSVRLELSDDFILVNNDSVNTGIINFRPFETKQIGVAKVLGNIERNSTSFILVKIRKDEQPINLPAKLRLSAGIQQVFEGQIEDTRTELLAITLEIKVTRHRGLFPTTDLLDFGLIRSGDQINPLILSVYSSLERGVEIESIYAEKQSEGVYLQFESRPPISIKCGAKGQPGLPVTLANLNIDTNIKSKKAKEIWEYEAKDDETIEASEMQEEQMVVVRQGLVVAETRGGNYNVSVPFRAVIYRGTIKYDIEATAFHQQLLPIVRREITITNALPFGLAIRAAEIGENGKNSFEASLATQPAVLLAPKQSLPSILLTYLHRKPVNFSTNLILHTNLTTFYIPITIFSGELKIHLYSLQQNEFHFGSVGWGERRTIPFTLSNPNPVSLKINRLNAPFPDLTSLHFIGMQRFEFENQSESTHRSEWHLKGTNRWISGYDFELPAHSFARFNISFSAPSNNSNRNAPTDGFDFFHIQTQFSSFNFPINFELVNYRLENVPSKIAFFDSFIGTVHIHPIKLFSTFPNDLRILKISIPDGDPRFQLYKPSNSSDQQFVPSKALSTIANIAFIPREICPENCYLGIELDSSDGQWFAYGMKLPQNLAEIDHYLYNRLRRKWLMTSYKKPVKTQISVDTDKVRGLKIPVEGHLVWPRLFSHTVVHFPLTAVGNFTIVNLTLHNPTVMSIIVQLLPLVIYPDADLLLDLFRPELPVPLTDPVEMNETLMFSLRDTELFTLKPGSPVPHLREEVEKVVGSPVPRFTQSLLLNPGMTARIRIGFLPSDYSLHSSLLIIRNNLTALEPVVLYGRGARMHMDIDNKTARSLPLMFEIKPQHLEDCANPRRQLHKLPTTLTVRRSFLVRNSGEVSFNVVNISVSNMPCENRGYRVLNCDRFRLEPNETQLLDIAYTPDFLLSTNEATLQLYIHMNGTPWAFDLVATIPPDLLSVCHGALPRPPFEGMMYYTCVFALTFCFICVISCAYLEGDRVITYAYRQQFSICQDGESSFELLSIFSTTTTPIMNPQMKTEQLEAPISRRNKQFLQIAADAGLFNRLFWSSLNFVLWLFSHIWPMLRSNNKPIISKKICDKSETEESHIASTSTDSEQFDRVESSDGDYEYEAIMKKLNKEEEDEQEVSDESTNKDEVVEEPTPHPTDPEQIHDNLHFVNDKARCENIAEDNIFDLSDPYLYQKFRSFLKSELTGSQRQHNSRDGSSTNSESHETIRKLRVKKLDKMKLAKKSSELMKSDEKSKERKNGNKNEREEKQMKRKVENETIKKVETGRKEDQLNEAEILEKMPKMTREEEDAKWDGMPKKRKTQLGKTTIQRSDDAMARPIDHVDKRNSSSSHAYSAARNTSNSSEKETSIEGNRKKQPPEWFQQLFAKETEKQIYEGAIQLRTGPEMPKPQEQRRKKQQKRQHDESIGKMTNSIWDETQSTSQLWGNDQRQVKRGVDDEVAFEESSDSSSAPEWADHLAVDISAGNLDEELGALANRSAALFGQSPESDWSAHSSHHSSTKDNLNSFTFDQHLTDCKGSLPSSSSDQISYMSKAIAKPIKREKRCMNEDARIQHIIDNLTMEYREKITKVLIATGKTSPNHQPPRGPTDELSAPTPSTFNFALPSDLSEKCEFEQNSTKFRRNENPSSSSTQRRKRISPGGEFSSRLRKRVGKSKETKEMRNPSPPRPQYDSLFNIGDPVWKPIGMLDEQPDWPATFKFTENEEMKKKK